MENYKEKYKDALERASKLRVQNPFDTVGQMVEHIFPELKESEDEWIRREIIDFLRLPHHQFAGKRDHEKWIAWLEKQKEPKDTGEISDGYHTFNELYRYRMLYNAAFFNLLPKELVHKSKRHHDGEECFGGGWFIVIANLPTGQISNHYELKDWDLFKIPEKEIADEWDGHTPQEAADRLHKYLLEKQGKKRPTDKVEPKFKVGDWVVNNVCLPMQIASIKDGMYIFTNGDTMSVLFIDGNYHLWTIQDAKEGDVLANKQNILILKELDYDWSCNGTPNAVKAYCGIKPNGNFEIGKDNWCFCGTLYIHPATKEQRDLLFQKMKEAGYGWNNERKELKKIEQNPADKSKFKVGDWFVNNNRKDVFLIKSIDANGYCTLEDIKGNIISPCLPPCESDSHIWTIEDANDGDLIYVSTEIKGIQAIFHKFENGIIYFHCNLCSDFTQGGYEPSGDVELVNPLQKTHYQKFFQKMKEAGYEWDSEKKELRKIEQKKVDADRVINWVNPNKVIEWLKNTIKEKTENYGVYEETRLILPYNSIEDLINDFKEDFGL